MRTKHFILPLTALLLLPMVPLHAAPERGRPNVVILLTDDQGTLDANCYGSTDLITPNIDKLAATAVRFTQAYAHTVCCPARAAMLTGISGRRSRASTSSAASAMASLITTITSSGTGRDFTI